MANLLDRSDSRKNVSLSHSRESARRLANFQRVSGCRWGYVPLTLAIWSHKLDGLIIARWPLKQGFTVGIDVPPAAGDFRAATPIMRTVGHCVRPFGTVATAGPGRYLRVLRKRTQVPDREGAGRSWRMRGGGKVGAAVRPPNYAAD